MFKNFFLATLSSFSPIFMAIEQIPSSPITAVILPILFFAVGKTVDVCVQIYFRRQEMKRRDRVVQREKVNGSLDA